MQVGRSSIRELAIYVGDVLTRNGIDAVLSGGACVAIYTRNKFMSYDLDFVLRSYEPRARVKEVLSSLGFFEEGRHFRHKDTKYLIDLVSPPLSVGEEPVKKIARIKSGNRVLCLLSPTDCVKDRLAAYYHWGDRQSLSQAIGVAKDNRISLSEIQRWSTNEGMADKFRIFLQAYRSGKR